jgi:hypothetical protein
MNSHRPNVTPYPAVGSFSAHLDDNSAASIGFSDIARSGCVPGREAGEMGCLIGE